jgi:hypothetical protein
MLRNAEVPVMLWENNKRPYQHHGVDKWVKPGYNTRMNKELLPRKKRVDRNHIVYELVVNGLNYIGVTAKTETTVLKSVRVRANKHFYRAKTENKDWALCVALRELASKDEIEIRVHEIIRGKAAAHRREVEIRRSINPALNTDIRGDLT